MSPYRYSQYTAGKDVLRTHREVPKRHTRNYWVGKLIEVTALVVTGIILALILSTGIPA